MCGLALFTATTIGPIYSIRLRLAPPVVGSLLDDTRINLGFVVLHLTILLGVGAALWWTAEPGTPPFGWRRDRLVRALVLSLAVLHLLLIASASWSRVEGRSFVQAGFFLLTTLSAVAVGAVLSLRLLLWVLVLSHHVLLAWSMWAIERGWPQSVDEKGRWAGLFLNKNSLGPVAALGLLAVAGLVVLSGVIRPRPRGRGAGIVGVRSGVCGRVASVVVAVVLVVLDVVVLERSRSVTPMVGTLAALGLPLVVVAGRAVARRSSRSAPIVIGVSLAGAAAASVASVALGRYSLARTLGRSPTLSGRTQLWGWLTHRVGERPLWGWGWLSVWEEQDLRRQVVTRFRIPFATAHNGVLEVALGAGLVAAGAAVGVFLCALALVVRWYLASPGPETWVALGAIGYVLAVNQLETFLGANLLPWALLIVVTVLAVRATTVGLSPSGAPPEGSAALTGVGPGAAGDDGGRR